MTPRKTQLQPAAPFNLSDVVPFAAPSVVKSASRSRDLAELFDKARTWSKASSAYAKASCHTDHLNWEQTRAMQKITTETRDSSHEASLDYFAASTVLPETLRTSPDLRWVGSLPTVEMAEVRRVVNALDMTVMPFAYLSPEAWSNETWEMSASIDRFNDVMSGRFHVYAAAPMNYYDVTLHVDAETDLPIFASDRLGPAFLAMGMAMPMFRAIKRDIQQIRDRTNQNTRRIQETDAQIASLAQRVSQLQAQVERQQAEQIQQALRTQQLETELREAEAQRSFMAYEPMLLAIPKSRSVLDDGRAIVGPCWGPDFPAIVMTALKLRRIDGQRSALTRALGSAPRA